MHDGRPRGLRVGIVPGSVAPESGGGYTFVHEILASLGKRRGGVAHEFVTVGLAGERAPGGDFQHVTLHPPAAPSHVDRVRAWLRGERDALALARDAELAAQLQRAQIDVLWYLAHGTQLTFEIPFITIVWDLQHRLQPFFPEVSKDGRWQKRDEIFGRSLRRAAAVITGTRRGQEEIERFFQVAAERIRILPHPTPRFALDAPPADDAAALRRLQLEPGFLLYPAQFWPHKNHTALVEAVSILKTKRGTALTLVLVGSDKGNRAHVEQAAARLGVGSSLRVLGFVDQQDLVVLYRQALALTYVTYFGPENLPPLEAFALGCPVIASNVPGSEEQLGDAALLVETGKPEQIADAVVRLIGEAGLKDTLVARGRARASRFTGDDFVSGVIGILDEFTPIRRTWPGSFSS